MNFLPINKFLPKGGQIRPLKNRIMDYLQSFKKINGI